MTAFALTACAIRVIATDEGVRCGEHLRRQIDRLHLHVLRHRRAVADLDPLEPARAQQVLQRLGVDRPDVREVADVAAEERQPAGRVDRLEDDRRAGLELARDGVEQAHQVRRLEVFDDLRRDDAAERTVRRRRTGSRAHPRASTSSPRSRATATMSALRSMPRAPTPAAFSADSNSPRPQPMSRTADRPSKIGTYAPSRCSMIASLPRKASSKPRYLYSSTGLSATGAALAGELGRVRGRLRVDCGLTAAGSPLQHFDARAGARRSACAARRAARVSRATWSMRAAGHRGDRAVLGVDEGGDLLQELHQRRRRALAVIALVGRQAAEGDDRRDRAR